MPVKKEDAKTSTNVDVTLGSAATTTLYLNGRSIEFIEGKASVDAETSQALKDAGFIE
jgi:hypothetical protein